MASGKRPGPASPPSWAGSFYAQVMSEANDLPPVTGAERLMGFFGLVAAVVIAFVCIDLATGGRITGAASRTLADANVGGCVDC